MAQRRDHQRGVALVVQRGGAEGIDAGNRPPHRPHHAVLLHFSLDVFDLLVQVLHGAAVQPPGRVAPCAQQRLLESLLG